MLSKKDITNLANLAKLELSPEEINLYEKQLEEVLGYVAKINKLDLTKIEASLSGVEEKNLVALRNDEVGTSDPSLLKQALHNKDNYVETPQVFER